MIHLALEPSSFSRDIAKCSRCGGVLSRYDFATDSFGRTLENCIHCGPMLLVLHVGAPVLRRGVSRNYSTTKPGLDRCACGKRLQHYGRGRKPIRCLACRLAERRARSQVYAIRYQEKRRAKRKAKTLLRKLELLELKKELHSHPKSISVAMESITEYTANQRR